MITKIRNRINLFKKFNTYKNVSKKFWKESFSNNKTNSNRITVEVSELNPLELEILQNAIVACKSSSKKKILISNFRFTDFHKIPLIFSLVESKINWTFFFNFYGFLLKPYLLIKAFKLFFKN